MHRSRLTLALGLLAACFLALPAMAGQLEPGTEAPDFTLTDHMGQNHKLSDYAGKVVVLEWTNPQCPFVRKVYGDDSMTDLQSWAKENEVVWLTINSSHFVTAGSMQEMAKKEGIENPILLDATGMVGHMYHAKTTPHMFVIGKDGKIVYEGAFDDNPKPSGKGEVNYVAAAMKAALAGEPAETAQTKPYGCSVKYAEKKAKENSKDKTAS